MSDSRSSLCTLLSHAVVAFTIEADNLYESRAPHRTTTGPVLKGRPWLTSMVMWQNCLRHLVEGPRTLAGLVEAAGTQTNLDGMHRWGYITVDTNGKRAPGRDAVLSLTERGRRAEAHWASVVPEIENRWSIRHPRYSELRAELEPIGRNLAHLPSSMPILGYGLVTRECVAPRSRPTTFGEDSLPELMARLLVQIAISFEERAPLSIAIYLDVMSAVGSGSVAVRELPRRAGISKEAVVMAMSYLAKRNLVSVEATATKSVRPTEAGLDAILECRSVLTAVEADIEQSYKTAKLREELESVCKNLSEGLVPLPGGWRTTAPERLPDFPMTLHRGGYPDGA